MYRMLLGLAAIALVGASPALGDEVPDRSAKLDKVNHIVVIYQENHSFDNLLRRLGRRERAQRSADAAHTAQVEQAGHAVHLPAAERRQPDVAAAARDLHATRPPARRSTATSRTRRSRSTTTSRRRDHLPAPGVFAPNGVPNGAGLPGGCTRDLVHRYYQEQYQLDGGKQDRYVTGSDAIGLTMGYYDTRQLPIYAYLHAPGHPHYAIADDFFQAAFGGSFLNHQWLIAAATPSGRTRSTTAAPTTCIRSSTRTACRPITRCTPPPGPASDECRSPRSAAPPAPRPRRSASSAATTRSTRPSRPTSRSRPAPHVAAGCRRRPRRRSATACRPRESTGRGTRAAGRTPTATSVVRAGRTAHGPTCADPTRARDGGLPELPGQAVPVPPPAVQLLRQLAPGTAARAAHLRDEDEFIDAAPPRRRTGAS